MSRKDGVLRGQTTRVEVRGHNGLQGNLKPLLMPSPRREILLLASRKSKHLLAVGSTAMLRLYERLLHTYMHIYTHAHI